MSEQPAGAVPEWTMQDRLQKALDYASIHVQEMADHLGINRNTVGNYLSGRTKRVPKAVRMQWAMLCGVDYRWLDTGFGADPSRGSAATPTDETKRPGFFRRAATAA